MRRGGHGGPPGVSSEQGSAAFGGADQHVRPEFSVDFNITMMTVFSQNRAQQRSVEIITAMIQVVDSDTEGPS